MGNHPPLVRTEEARLQAIGREIELTGSVEAARIARLASPGEGPVLICQWREGDRVKKGEVLVEIGREKAATAELASARQLLLEQELELKRMETLVAAGAIPAVGLDAARSKHENARAQVAKAEQNAGDYLVKAPWAGIVSKVLIKDGDYVAPRTTLVEMFDPASLVIRFAAPESQAMSLREDMGVGVRLDAYPGRTWQGKISRIYPELEPRTRTRTVEALLMEPVALIPGMFARLAVEQEAVGDAVAVPAAAVIATPHGDAAYVVEEGKAVRRQVTTGIEAGGSIQILSGLRAGEQVITAGHEKLKDGSPVRVAGAGHGGEQGGHQAADSGHPGHQPSGQDHQPVHQPAHQSEHQSDHHPGDQPNHQPKHQPDHQPNHQPDHESGGHGQ
jgi:membrane fusion protein (multidrug efflux system)